MSISTGTRVQCSIAYFATSPEWNAVPHATTNTLSTSRRTSVSVCSSSSASRPCSLTRPTSVSRIAAGCSWISFSMKSSNPPFCARATSHSTSKGSTSTSLPSRSVTRTPSARTSTTWFSSIGRTVRVFWSTAGMSDARTFSPSPSPTISGEETRTPTMTSGSSSARTTSAYAPSSSRTVARTRSASEPSCSSIRWATTSVSVSESRTWPRFSSPERRSVKFSMIPLWITAMRRLAVQVRDARCGRSARRGSPTACGPSRSSPGRRPRPRARASSSDSLPARFTTERPPSIIATPAESYPRYSRRRRPSRTTGSAWSGPT